MPSHKMLKGIVRSLTESFTSLMNYYDKDYVMGHVVKAAWRKKATEFRVNILTGEMSESKLLTKPVVRSINHYVNAFPDLVTRSHSSLEFIKSVELLVTVDPTIRRPFEGTKLFESPFTCTVSLVDDRGKHYAHTVKGWWYPES